MCVGVGVHMRECRPMYMYVVLCVQFSTGAGATSSLSGVSGSSSSASARNSGGRKSSKAPHTLRLGKEIVTLFESVRACVCVCVSVSV